MNALRQRVFLFVFLLPVLLFSQYDNRLGKAPLLKTFDTQTLAHALTDSLPNDSLKVRSIYLWMATHINYDISGLVSGRGSYENPRAILIHRKAVCLGYSILFDSLCAVAGIPAEVVLGYVYMPWYEARDTFYLDTHAWNAVQVDGEWKLIDVTWGCGQLKLKKQPVRKYFCKLFHVPCPPAYRYVRKVNDHYFFTPPEQMVLDHLPSTPAWQLLDCYVPLDSFQHSPKSTQNFLDNPVNCKSAADSIEKVAASFEPKRMVVSGKQALAFNRHNHQDISFGSWIYANSLIEHSKDTTLPLETRVLYCDSSMKMLDSLIRYYRASSRDARDEGNYFLRRNRRMKKQVESESRPLLRAHMQQGGQIKRERFITIRQIRRLQIANQQLRRDSRSIKRKKVNVRRPPNSNDAQQDQRQELEQKYQENADAAAGRTQNMSGCTCSNFIPESQRYDTLLAEQKRRVRIELNDMRAVNYFKQNGYTCYDTLVYAPKNEALLVHRQEDSLQTLIRPAGKWQMDSARKVCDAEAKKAKMLLRQNLSLLNQMGHLPAGAVDEKSEAKKIKAEYIAINDSLIRSNKAEIDALKRHYKVMFKMRKLHRKVRRQLRYELHEENWRYAGTAKFFSTYYRGVSIMFQNNIRFTSKIKSDVRQRKSKLNRQIRKKKREEEKRKK